MQQSERVYDLEGSWGRLVIKLERRTSHSLLAMAREYKTYCVLKDVAAFVNGELSDVTVLLKLII